MKLSDILLEGWNDREVKGKISDLSYDVLSSYFESERFNLPNDDDSSRTIFNQNDFEHYRDEIVKRYGDVEVELDKEGQFDDDRFKILDKKFLKDKADYIKAKGAALDRWRQSSNYGLDQKIMKLSKVILENNKVVHRSELSLSEKDVNLLAETITNKLEDYLDTGDREFLTKTVQAAINDLLKETK